MSNCPWCQIVLLAWLVSNCPRCQIVRGVKLSHHQKYHLQKFHPKFSNKKNFHPKNFFTESVRLSFVDLRWAQLYVSLVLNVLDHNENFNIAGQWPNSLTGFILRMYLSSWKLWHYPQDWSPFCCHWYLNIKTKLINITLKTLRSSSIFWRSWSD